MGDEKKIKSLKLLILNYPNNPTGLSYTKNELKSIAKICKENNTLVLSDEIYSRLNHKNDHVSISKYYPVFSNGEEQKNLGGEEKPEEKS